MNLPTRHTLEARLVFTSNGEPRRILTAGDDPALVERTTAILRIMGFEVEAAHTLHAALELAGDTAFDFIITSFDLGRMAGLELARSIKGGHGPSAGARILALTDHAAAAALRPDWAGLIDGFERAFPSRHELRFALMKLLEPVPPRRALQALVTGRALTPQAAAAAVPAPPPPVMLPPIVVVQAPQTPARTTLSPAVPVLALPPVARPAPPPPRLVPPVAAKAPPPPAARPAPKTWRGFALGLPEEFTGMVVMVAAIQAHCFITEVAKAGAAKEDLTLLKARRKLASLAESFEMDGITDLLEQHPGSRIGLVAKDLFKALDRWQSTRPALKAVA